MFLSHLAVWQVDELGGSISAEHLRAFQVEQGAQLFVVARVSKLLNFAWNMCRRTATHGRDCGPCISNYCCPIDGSRALRPALSSSICGRAPLVTSGHSQSRVMIALVALKKNRDYRFDQLPSTTANSRSYPLIFACAATFACLS